MTTPDEPATPEMMRDLIQAQTFDLVRDQISVNAILLQVITRLATHISLPREDFVKTTKLVSEGLESLKEQSSKVMEVESLLGKLHNIPRESIDGK